MNFLKKQADGIVPAITGLNGHPVVIRPDLRLNLQDLRWFIQEYSSLAEAGTYHITIVKENGQGYNLVFHEGGATPKLRIALVSDDYPELECIGSWDARDVIIQELGQPWHRNSDPEAPDPDVELIDTVVMGSIGCALITIEHGRIAQVHLHRGELWP
jgi:hypothetical protein